MFVILVFFFCIFIYFTYKLSILCGLPKICRLLLFLKFDFHQPHTLGLKCEPSPAAGWCYPITASYDARQGTFV